VKKLIAAFIFIIICLSALSACKDKPTETSEIQSKPTVESSESGESNKSEELVQVGYYKPVVSSYAFAQLSEKEQKLYAQMKDALLNHAPEISEGLEEYNAENLNKTIRFVLLDYPGIFWANEAGTTYTNEINGVKTTVKYEFNYIVEQSRIDNMQNQINSAVNEFLNSLEDGLSEYERTLAVYEYLIQTTDYDTSVMNKIANGLNGLKDDEIIRSQTIASVFIDRKTVCSGYSKATQYLLNKVGIFCVYISGSARGQGDNHAWNLVKIDGDYYFLDTTWGNPVSMNPAQEKRMTYNYFLLTSREISKSHTPNDMLVLPDCTATKYNYFVYNNLLLNEYNPSRIEEILIETALERRKGADIKFSDDEIAEKAIEALFGDESEIFDILRKVALVNAETDPANVSYSIDPDANVIYIELRYK